VSAATPSTGGPPKARVAALSIVSNSALIVLKAVAGALTGSVALLTEALHSATDLIASIVAFFSVRKADEPPDVEHPYGHEKVEDLAAAIEGVLILVGSAIIVIEAVRSLVRGAEVERLGIGIAVLAISIVVNLVVSARLMQRARETGSPALAADAAHLRTDVATSVGVLVGLVVVTLTGWTWLDPVIALLVASAIVVAGMRILLHSGRVLVDEALPAGELEGIREQIAAFADRGVAGPHDLRARRAGARRHVALHLQFRQGTTLEQAHRTAHELQDAIRDRVGDPDADVLIHIEPEAAVRPDRVASGALRGTARPDAATRG
jgi:cation diffusion facilitator family transporter